jgi:hypothetical protein
MIVGLISLASVPISVLIEMTLFVSKHDLAVFFSRILIGLAYAVGGIHALLIKE